MCEQRCSYGKSTTTTTTVYNVVVTVDDCICVNNDRDYQMRLNNNFK